MELLLDPEICERARQTRDPRFDGRFFIGVKTTGVYCRPVCPVRIPLAHNVAFYPTAAAAAEAGFRPCLRCRPETAPGTPAWNGTGTTVNRALRLIEDGALDDAGVQALALRLGLGARHLNRLFQQHLGASPLAVAQTRRLHFAKKLIDETDLPMSEIALAAGFGSIRRFNALFAQTYQRSPGSLRRQQKTRPGPGLVLQLSYRPPYNWTELLKFLSLRRIAGIEQIAQNSYRRSISIGGVTGWYAVSPGEGNKLQLRMQLPESRYLAAAVNRVRRQFDLTADPLSIRAHLGQDPLLAPLIRRHPGLRLPSAWSGFEVAVRAIVGQQVSVAAARTLVGRLVERFGASIGEFPDGEPMYAFPDAAALCGEDLTQVGLPGKRAECLQRIANAVADAQLDFDTVDDPAILLEQLLAFPGIGPWTAQYIAMRGLGEPDAFPTDDLGLLRATGLPARQLRERAENWRPWRAYAALYLWHGDHQPGGNQT